MTITGQNTNGYQISVRWNRYLGTLVVDVSRSEVELICGRALRFGDQDIGYGIRALITNQNKSRYFGDILDADIAFYSGCSV